MPAADLADRCASLEHPHSSRFAAASKEDRDGELTVHSLPDDLLALVMRRLLPPLGLLASRAALRDRATHLRLSYLKCRKFERAAAFADTRRLSIDDGCDVAWRACLATYTSNDAADLLLRNPPWQQGAAADELYAAAAPLPALRVCSRWRELLLHGPVVKVAVYGVDEVPPSQVEVLVLASCEPWRTDMAMVSRLKYLQDLPALKALFFCCFLETPPSSACMGAANVSLPIVPSGLSSLRHLVYADQRCRGGSRAEINAVPGLPSISQPLVNSLAALSSLETLGLPELSSSRGATLLQTLRSLLPPLRDLHARTPGLADCCSSGRGLTALRSIRVTFVGNDVAAFSTLPALRALSLTRRSEHPGLVGIGFLTQLSSLELNNFFFLDGAEAIVGLSTLSSLRIISATGSPGAGPRADTRMVDALGTLARIPRLALSIQSSGDVIGLAKLTALEVLDLAMAAQTIGTFMLQCDIKNADRLSALTCLTELRLSCCHLVGGGCAALGHMARLKKLHLLNCEIPDPTALRALTALQTLYVDGGCCRSRDPDAWLAAMQLPGMCPGLKTLTLSLPARLSIARLDEIARLSELEVLDLGMNKVTDAGIARLAQLQQLRALHLDVCRGLTAAGLRQLTSCQRLQCLSTCGNSIPVDADEVVALMKQDVLVKVA